MRKSGSGSALSASIAAIVAKQAGSMSGATAPAAPPVATEEAVAAASAPTNHAETVCNVIRAFNRGADPKFGGWVYSRIARNGVTLIDALKALGLGEMGKYEFFSKKKGINVVTERPQVLLDLVAAKVLEMKPAKGGYSIRIAGEAPEQVDDATASAERAVEQVKEKALALLRSEGILKS